MYKKIVFLFGLILVLNSCGGGGGEVAVSSNTNPPTDTDTQDIVTESTVNTNSVELGPVKEADVNIYTIDTKQLVYSTVTDDKGRYKINIEEFNNSLNSLAIYPKYLLVTATNGIDIDPEDDGDLTNSDPIAVNGTVKGIFKVTTLLNSEYLSINLLSTAISEILNDKKKIDDEQIAYIAKELGIEDINGDGIINNQDIYYYKMAEYDSEIEDKLRKTLLDTIHKGDNQRLQEVTDELIKEYNLMFISYVLNGSTALLTIESSKEDSQILYKINAVQNDLLTEIYSSPISLNKNDYVVYKECKDNRCSSIQIASFDGEVIHQYFLRTSNFGIYEDIEYMNGLRKSIIDNDQKIKELDIDIEYLDKQIKENQEDINEINSKIEYIKNQSTNYEL